MMTRAALLCSFAGLAGLTAVGLTHRPGPATAPGASFGKPAGLARPSSLPLAAFEEKLFAFLNERQYQALGWAVDKEVRDTGPFRDGVYHGTHPAVRVYYSPGVMKWLLNGRQGPIPDGEVIVKEQYPAPAARHAGKSEAELWASLESWTVMVKDSAGSHDGWFWSNPAKGQCVKDPHPYPFDYPDSGFGLYCVRCHAAAQSPGTAPADRGNEFTFASLRNVAGFPGDPLRFQVDDSWRKEAKKSDPADAHSQCVCRKPVDRPARKPDAAFAGLFKSLTLTNPAEVAALPPLTYDHVVPRRGAGPEFVTSGQCMNCHAGLTAPFGPSMFVPFGKSAEYGATGWDVSPHGEWRWTPMGLAGRDPVFYAQVESELRLIDQEFGADAKHAQELKGALMDTCLRCHGAMGRRQFHQDHPDAKEPFTLAHAAATAGPHAQYGALARDGVSCAVCHRMQPKPQPAGDRRPYLQYFLESQITGNFHLGPPGEVYGPFQDAEVSPYAMAHATGWTPKHNAYLKSSQLCGTCHTVALPAIDYPLDQQELAVVDEVRQGQAVELFKKCHHHVEQATYLEWLNSEYEDELHPENPKARSCQDCHMAPGLTDERHGIDIPKLRTRIAAVQDPTYPEAENLPPAEQLNVRVRENYRRHNFAGLNAFLVELFRQHPDVLGVRPTDFMTGSKLDAGNAVAAIARTARRDTADLSVTAAPDGPGRLTAKVLVTNRAGHRFPSGVGFRRAFLALEVVRAAAGGKPEQVVWASGRTNAWGVLLGPDGAPLPTETFERDAAGQQQFQPHHEVIDSERQVQIYETLVRNKKGDLTTSFVRGCTTAKDNRLLPRGWKKAGPGPELTGRFLEATHPDTTALADPHYADGSGMDEVTYRIALPAGVDATDVTVRATLYYQALPPYYLANLFTTAPDGPAAQRLHSLIGHLDLAGTPVEGWKLKVAEAAADVKSRR